MFDPQALVKSNLADDCIVFCFDNLFPIHMEIVSFFRTNVRPKINNTFDIFAFY